MKNIAILLLQTVFLASSSAFGRNGELHAALTFMSTPKGHETLMSPPEKHPDFSTVPANEFLAGKTMQELLDFIAEEMKRRGFSGSAVVAGMGVCMSGEEGDICSGILRKAQDFIRTHPEIDFAHLQLFLLCIMPSECNAEIMKMRPGNNPSGIAVYGGCNQMNVNVDKADQYVKEG